MICLGYECWCHEGFVLPAIPNLSLCSSLFQSSFLRYSEAIEWSCPSLRFCLARPQYVLLHLFEIPIFECYVVSVAQSTVCNVMDATSRLWGCLCRPLTHRSASCGSAEL
jgi:hypothetical protein